jgi:alpha-D-ribose 1-methylphosphonate 5-triphosphate synthase subunit PhnI
VGYVAARGGAEAIEAAEELVRRRRTTAPSPWLELDQLTGRLGLLVDRVMGEAGLWAPALAARAVRQAEGDLVEAAHLVRAHLSRLPRYARSEAVLTDEIDVVRRIVPAFRQAPGPQLLGRTVDYTGRLLDLEPDESARHRSAHPVAGGHRPAPAGPAASVDQHRPGEGVAGGHGPATAGPAVAVDRRVPGRLLDVLRGMDLVVDRRRHDDPEPVDITAAPVGPGAPRSARLSVMARAETGALVNLWYRNILGPDSHLHEVTLGEVRHGRLPVRVRHPVTGGAVTVARVEVTEVEAIEDLDGIDEDRTRFDVGYGLCLGHNERKAIAMANLDIALHRDRGRTPLAQSVLMTTDGLDSSGFLEHLKLPHYVTFRSMVERKMAMRSERATGNRRGRTAARVASTQPSAP